MKKLTPPRQVSSLMRKSISFIQGFPASFARIWKKKTPQLSTSPQNPICEKITQFLLDNHYFDFEVKDFIPNQFDDGAMYNGKYTIILKHRIKPLKKKIQNFCKKQKFNFELVDEKTGWIDDIHKSGYILYSVEDVKILFFVCSNDTLLTHVSKNIQKISICEIHPGKGYEIGAC